MLVLSRKVNEQIIIDGCIRIRIVSVKGNQVRLGIDAPPEFVVNRAEVQQRYLEFAEKLMTEPAHA